MQTGLPSTILDSSAWDLMQCSNKSIANYVVSARPRKNAYTVQSCVELADALCARAAQLNGLRDTSAGQIEPFSASHIMLSQFSSSS